MIRFRKFSVLTALLIMAMPIVCYGKYIPLTKKSSSYLRSLELVATIDAEYKEQSKKLTIDFYEDFGDVILSMRTSMERKFGVDSFERLRIRLYPFLFSQLHLGTQG